MRIRTIALTILLATVSEAGPVVYVAWDAPPGGDGTSWATAFQTIGEALSAAGPPQEIWVKGGTYTETIVLVEGVSVYGGFAGTETERSQRNPAANETIVDGGGSGPVVTAASYLTFDGFTVTGGAAPTGAGVYASGCTGLVVSGSLLEGNSAFENGGGAYVSNCPGIVFSGNTLRSNTAQNGGGLYLTSSTDVAVSNNSFIENSAHEGGGIRISYSTGLISGNLFQGNESTGLGAGFYAINDTSDLILENCTFGDNTNPGVATHGGAVALANASIVIRRCLMTGNEAGLGAGIYCLMSSPTVEFCTIVANTGNQGAGLWASTSTSPTVRNCIIALNTPEGIRSVSGTGTLTYNDVWGNGTDYVGITPGTGSISADPLFIDPARGCYRLDYGSPCVNSGTSDGVNPDGTTDMGVAPVVVVPTDAGSIGAAAGAVAGQPFGAGVHVKHGVYNENVVLPAEVDLIGAGAGLCIIDPLGTGTGIKSTAAGTTYVKGLTVRNAGNGGMYFQNGWRAVTSCEVIDCLPYSTAQGGISFRDCGGLIAGCYLARNGDTSHWGGGIGCVFANPTIRDNLIEDNLSWAGGGISLYGTSPLIANNTLRRNKGFGAGIACVYSSNPLIVNNIIADNNGVGILEHPHAGRINTPVLRHNIFWNNSNGHYLDQESNQTLYTAEEIDALDPPGTNFGTIVADPLLLPSGRITLASPGLDGGHATGSTGRDLFGTQRPVDGDGDMTAAHDVGAHEYLPGTYDLSVVVKWNLLSLPVLPADAEVSAALGGLGIPLEGAVYRYGPSGYEVYPWDFTQLEVGRGYWLSTSSPAATEVSGQYLRGRFEITLAQGWHLIASPREEAVPLSTLYLRSATAVKTWSEAVAAGWVGGTLYRYEEGSGYIGVSEGGAESALLPGCGYWLRKYYEAGELSLVFP